MFCLMYVYNYHHFLIIVGGGRQDRDQDLMDMDVLDHPEEEDHVLLITEDPGELFIWLKYIELFYCGLLKTLRHQWVFSWCLKTFDTKITLRNIGQMHTCSYEFKHVHISKINYIYIVDLLCIRS